MKIIILYFIAFLFLTLSCRNQVQESPADMHSMKKKDDETLVKINNYVAKRNRELIGQFVKRTALDLQETGSGLWYGIYNHGQGKQVEKGDLVKIAYILRLLDGTVIDTVSVNYPKTFRAGKGGVEAGIEEGILYLHEGDKLQLIIPPHLAYGNFGDQEKIPSSAILFYDLFLLEAKP